VINIDKNTEIFYLADDFYDEFEKGGKQKILIKSE